MKTFLKLIFFSITMSLVCIVVSSCSLIAPNYNDVSNSSIDEPAKSEFESGEGTKNDPYVIAEDYQWLNINNHLNAYYQLKNNIYLEDLGAIKPIGSSDKPFEGVIDGKNFTVSNAVISNDDECGLFGCISGGEVKNLNFEDSALSLNVTGDGAYIGSFAANLKKGSLIENCHTNNISMTETAHGNILGYPKFYAAGFIGIVQSASKVIYCSCNVSSNAKGNRTIYIAGFVGKMNGGEIDACYCSGSFDANPSSTGGGTPSNRIGGFVYTFSAGTITNVYTETVFNYVGYAGMFTYENMDDLDYILSFVEFGHTSKDLGEQMYYKADIINNAITLSCCKYYGPVTIALSNSILDTEVWARNNLWVKGKVHPELVAYEEYKKIQGNSTSNN